MRYVGSKKKIARQIRDIILEYRGNRDVYWEPFVGGCNSFSVIASEFRKSYASDSHEDLILMWQAVMDGWEPPVQVSEQAYNKLKTADSSALRGFVGFGGSFGGKWFGGYARGGFMADGSPRNHQAESARAVMRRFKDLSGHNVRFLEPSPYWRGRGSKKMVIYCDPPYASRLGYQGSGFFDHNRFWRWCKAQTTIGSLVLVSEYDAPDEWDVVGEFDHKMSVSLAGDRRNTIERLFVHRDVHVDMERTA